MLAPYVEADLCQLAGSPNSALRILQPGNEVRGATSLRLCRVAKVQSGSKLPLAGLLLESPPSEGWREATALAKRQRSRSAGVGTVLYFNDPPQGLAALAPPGGGESFSSLVVPHRGMRGSPGN
ncbi:MAG TPA: hypothetical protein VFS12_03880 [Terriglobia bacterium]|nr:hypothetical protein [Terriglobia bacterium]